MALREGPPIGSVAKRKVNIVFASELSGLDAGVKTQRFDISWANRLTALPAGLEK